MHIAVYPGSFDPTTNGHLDIITRASKLCDRLIVAVLENPSKKPMFTVEERVNHLKIILKEFPNVEVKSFSGLLVDFVRSVGANIVIRGLRGVTDFSYEFQMALTNRSLANEIETLFISADTQYLFFSSSQVKEIALFDGNIDNMVPQIIKDEINKKLKNNK
ncbi:MAG: pantetheine-phosphate adenylyltransferase [Clostridia bacterium]|nr:pantetheine-phosphate adenylyltransferase [Clostridia bacterium]